MPASLSRPCACAAAALLVLASLARAASPAGVAAPASDIVRLHDIVVTATRTERDINATPGTITAVDLSDAFAADLRETLRQETLVTVPFTFSGAGVAYQRSGANSVNIRGIEGNRVLLQVDGVRVPDEFRLGGSEPIGRDYFDPELFKRLEILQGSASALYGSDALGGVVTFTTKSPEDFGLSSAKPFHVSARIGYRSADDSLATSGTVAASTGPLSALVVYSRRDGHETENNGTVAPNPEDYRSDSVLAKLAWRPAPPHRFEFTLEHFKRTADSAVDNKEVTAGTATTTELALDSRTQRFRLGAGYLFARAPGGHGFFDTLDARLYFQDANTRDVALERIAYNPPNAASGTFRDRLITTSFNNDTRGFSVAAVKTAGSAHRFAYGLDGSRTDTNKPWSSINTTQRTGTSYPLEPRMAETRTDRLGAYLQDEWEWRLRDGRKLTLIPGARLDQFKLTPDNSAPYLAVTAGQAAPGFDAVALSPKLGAVLGLTPRLNGYAQYNRGFRYPTAEDLTATFTNPTARYRTIPNPDLQEETSDAFEIGVKGHVARGIVVRLAAFHTRYRNFIEQIVSTGVFDPAWPSGVFQTQNRAAARIHGAELWSRVSFGDFNPELAGFSLTAAVGRSKGSYRAVGGIRETLTSVEPLKASATLAYDVPRGRFGAAVSVQHTARGRPGIATQFTAPACTIADLTFTWRPHPRLTLHAALHNLTDRRYWRYGSIRGVSTTSLAEQQRRTEPGFNSALSAVFRY